MKLNKITLIALAAVVAVAVTFIALKSAEQPAGETPPVAQEQTAETAAPAPVQTPEPQQVAETAPEPAQETGADTAIAPDKESPIPVPGVNAPAEPSEQPVAPGTPADTPDASAPAPEETPAPVGEAPVMEDSSTAAPDAQSASVTVDAERALEERVLGNDNAPVTLIEYASMTCPHCAEFNKTIFPQIKKNFIDTGKVKLVYRDLPTDAIASKAAAMARCAPHEQYFNMVETIYGTQERWIVSPNIEESLTRIGTLAGMSPELIAACMENEDIRRGMLRRVEFAQQKWFFTSTPSFVIQQGVHEEVFKGVLPYEDIAAKINKLAP